MHCSSKMNSWKNQPELSTMLFCLQNGMTVWGFLTGNKFDYVATLLLWISSWNVYGEGSGAQICKRLPLRRQEEMGCLSRSSHHYLKWHLNWILEIAFSVYVSKSFFFFFLFGFIWVAKPLYSILCRLHEVFCIPVTFQLMLFMFQ